MTEIKGKFEEKELKVAAPTDLELQGLRKVMENLVDRYTQADSKDITILQRDYQYKDKYWEIELEEQLEAGFLESNQYINSVFINDGTGYNKQVLVKVFDETKDDFIFFEVWC